MSGTSSGKCDESVRPIDLQTQDDSGLVAVSSRTPALRWKLSSQRAGVAQRAYEIQCSRHPDFSVVEPTSGRVDCAQVHGGSLPHSALASRETVWCRVRLWTDLGETCWSDALRLEGSLFDLADWIGRPISPAFNVDCEDAVPPTLLRKRFDVRAGLVKARLYVTAQGLHQSWLNAAPVSGDLFEPGWTEYRSRLLYSTYDVTTLLHEGGNVLGAVLADGWWRGNLTWIPNRAVYGATTAYLAQLELTYTDGTTQLLATDESWRASQGSIRSADIYNGCTVDLAQERAGWLLPGFDDSGWDNVLAFPLPTGLEQRSMPPVTVVQDISVEVIAGSDCWRVDCRQNLTGWLRLTVQAAKVSTVTVRHAEVLDQDSSLHLSSLRSAEATDRYTIPPGRHVLEPAFTFHGFRYADILLPQGMEVLHCEARVLTSALRRIGTFKCSDPQVNQLYENIIWSQRGNFLSIPTDCPQRDERLGWTGDIQAFAPTACTNFDCRTFLASWLADLSREQRPDGNVPSTVPNVIWGHPYEYGGVGWGDAATLVPWALFEAYGDTRVLAEQFESMKAWVDYGMSRLDASGVWSGDFHLGDWLDPAAPPGHPELATTDRDYVASCYLSHSARVLARVAGILGLLEQSARYEDAGRAVAQATWTRWESELQCTQTGCALAIEFDIAPPESRSGIGQRLASLVDVNAGRIGTGFLGTPLVLPALTRTGHNNAALKLLLNQDAPGWLYQVRHGATTVWERWDAIRPDGSIHPGDLSAEDSPGMMSFNHYAYGSVGAWLYRSLAGISPEEPGYAAIRFAPCPGEGIEWAQATIETPFGYAAISWAIRDGTLNVTCTTPPGATGVFSAPAGWGLMNGNPSEFGSGERTFVLTPASAN